MLISFVLRAEAEGGGRDRGEGSGPYRAHGGADGVCLRALGGWIAEHAKSTFRLGVLRALAVASTHYLMDLQRVSSGYVVPDDADADAASVIMDEADAATEEFATVLVEKLEADIPPIAEFDAPEGPRGGDGSL